MEARGTAEMKDLSSLALQSAGLTSELSAETTNVINARIFRSGTEQLELVSGKRAASCSGCLTSEPNLCAKVQEKVDGTTWLSATSMLESTLQTVPPRRSIYHPKEWSEYIPVICQGWAASSITLPDGRRQILSFVLPGDMVSTAGFLEPMSGRTVEAVTEVTYRKFKRSELRAFLFAHSDLMDMLSRMLVEERMEADQLALDLGRRPADERIARLILKLAKRLAPRGMMNGQTMEFPLRQRHIADATGLTPVHVSKMMGELQRAELIEISDRSLTILNDAELYRIADWR
jgi:CRP/FNR family transcriptional regulator